MPLKLLPIIPKKDTEKPKEQTAEELIREYEESRNATQPATTSAPATANDLVKDYDKHREEQKAAYETAREQKEQLDARNPQARTEKGEESTKPIQPTLPTFFTVDSVKGKRKVQLTNATVPAYLDREEQRLLALAEDTRRKSVELANSVNLNWKDVSSAYREKQRMEQEAKEYERQAAEVEKYKEYRKYESYRDDPYFWQKARDGESNPKAAVLGRFNEGQVMTDGERSMYYYLWGAKGAEAALNYYHLIEESLSARAGAKEAEELKSAGMGGLMAPIAGVEGAIMGAAQAFAALFGKQLPTSQTQYASQEIRKDLAVLPGAAYDVAYTVGNMAPSMLLSAGLGAAGVAPKAAQIVGAASFGLPSAGNAYKEGIERGYSQGEALTYGLLNGASEAGLQYLLGGISSLGGVGADEVASKMAEVLAKVIKNPQVVTFVSEMAASMGAEFTEEYLQQVLDPVFKNMMGEQNDVRLFSGEALYAGILGALTAGLLEGPGIVANARTAVDTNPADMPHARTADVPAQPAGLPIAPQTPSAPLLPTFGQTTAPVAQNLAQTGTRGVDRGSVYAEKQGAADGEILSGAKAESAPAQSPVTVSPDSSKAAHGVRVSGDVAFDTTGGVMGLPRPATQEEIAEQAREAERSKKSSEYKRTHERAFVSRMSEMFGVPKGVQGKFHQLVSEIGDAVVKTGVLDEETKNALFDALHEEARAYDTTAKESLGQIIKYLRTSRIKPDGLTAEQRRLLWGKVIISKTADVTINGLHDDLISDFGEIFEPMHHDGDAVADIVAIFDNARMVEMTLDQSMGEHAEQFKSYLRNEFENNLFQLRMEMNLVDRYEVVRFGKKKAKETAEAYANVKEKVSEALKKEKSLEKKRQRVADKLLLTDGDRKVVDALISGGMTFDDIAGRANLAEIREYYNAVKALKDNMEVIDLYNRNRRAALFSNSLLMLQNSDTWTDKKAGVLYSRETQERNIRDIVKDRTDADLIEAELFAPVHENEAANNRYKAALRDRMKEGGLNRHEQVVAQLVHEIGDYKERLAELAKRGRGESGEAKMYAEALNRVNAKYTEYMAKHGSKVDLDKCNRALDIAYKVYGELFEKFNEMRIRNGYKPMEFRKNYLPHYNDGTGDTTLGNLAKELGFLIENQEIPTDIAGLTYIFRPGTRFVGPMLERTGTKTSYGLYEGFDGYLDIVSDAIHHTDDIQRLRSFDAATRYKYSPAGIRESILDVIKDDNLTDEEIYKRVVELRESSNRLTHYVQNITEYTNGLAGKKAIHDRGAEYDMGRRIYGIMNKVQGRVAGNMTVANVSVALSNFIPLTQAVTEVSPVSLSKAMYKSIASYIHDDGFVERSDYLTNRRGAERLFVTTLGKVEERLNVLFKAVDYFVADTLVRAKYAENLKAGMTEGDALRNADAWAGGLMADRSKGALPTVFKISNPVTKIFTLFQVEVNNQLSYLFKDVPRDLRDKGLAAIAWALFKAFLAAYAYNELDEEITGNTRRAFDPIGIILDLLGVEFNVGINGEKFGYQVDGGVIGAKNKSQTTDAVLNAWKSAANIIPFVGSQLGGDGGRVPVASAIPSLWNIGEAIIKGDKNIGQVALDELQKPFWYLLMPFGGGQLKKTIGGISTVAAGGSYKKNADGSDQLRFRTDQKMGDYLQAGVFGKWALPEAREYVKKGFPILSAGDTQAYQAAIAAGIDGTHFLALRTQIKGYTADKGRDGKTTWSAAQKARKTLWNDASLTPEQKRMLDDYLVGGDFVADYSSETMFRLSQMGSSTYEKAREKIADGWSAEDVLFAEEYKDGHKFTTLREGLDKNGAIIESASYRFKDGLLSDKNLTADEKMKLYKYFAANDRFNQNVDSGKSAEDVLLIEQYALNYSRYEPITGQDGDASETTTEQFRKALYADASLTPQQKSMIDNSVLASKFVADYSSKEMFELSMKGESAYYRVKDLVKAGYKQADALLVESFYDSFGDGYGNGRKGLYADNSLTAVQKAMIDRALTGKSADYAHGEAMYELSVMSIENNSKAYTRAQGYVKGGITPDQALKIEQHYKEHRTKAAMLDYMRNVLKLNDEKINIVLVQLNWKPI